MFNKVCDYLNLLEKDYFGLSFRDQEDSRNWLNLEKRIGKQLKSECATKLPLILIFYFYSLTKLNSYQ